MSNKMEWKDVNINVCGKKITDIKSITVKVDAENFPIATLVWYASKSIKNKK